VVAATVLVPEKKAQARLTRRELAYEAS